MKKYIPLSLCILFGITACSNQKRVTNFDCNSTLIEKNYTCMTNVTLQQAMKMLVIDESKFEPTVSQEGSLYHLVYKRDAETVIDFYIKNSPGTANSISSLLNEKVDALRWTNDNRKHFYYIGNWKEVRTLR
jgi:hypothetical protein